MPTTAMNDWLARAGVKNEVLGKVKLGNGAAGAAASAVASAAPSATPGGLPSPMLPDCKIVHGKVPGPKNHLLCEKHGHVVDIDQKMIIAQSVADYCKSHPAAKATPAHASNGASAAAAAPSGAAKAASVAGAAAPSGAAKAASVAGAASPAAQAQPASAQAATGGAAAANGAAPANGAGAAGNAGAAGVADPAAEAKKIIALLKIEQEGFESYVETYTDFMKDNKSSLLRRGVAAVSQALNDSDDPGDELDKMRGQLMREQMVGIGTAGTYNFVEARKHLETMRTIAENARKLILHFTTDDSGASRAVTGLKVVSKAGDIATEGLSVVAPPIGKGLAVAKKAGVAGMQVYLGQPVNWAEFTIEVGCDLFFDKIKGGELAKRVGGPLTSRLVAKFGTKVSKELIEKSVENVVKYEIQTVAKTTAGTVYEVAKGKEITYEEFLSRMVDKMTDPSEVLFAAVNAKVEGELRK